MSTYKSKLQANLKQSKEIIIRIKEEEEKRKKRKKKKKEKRKRVTFTQTVLQSCPTNKFGESRSSSEFEPGIKSGINPLFDWLTILTTLSLVDQLFTNINTYIEAQQNITW